MYILHLIFLYVLLKASVSESRYFLSEPDAKSVPIKALCI